MDSISLIACAETAILQQVAGVGPLIALTFILTVDDKSRFQKSRDIGCYVGLRSDSGQSQPQLRITKEGDPYLRDLVQGAHHIISRRGPDTDPKRWGHRSPEVAVTAIGVPALLSYR
jgi:transposase